MSSVSSSSETGAAMVAADGSADAEDACEGAAQETRFSLMDRHPCRGKRLANAGFCMQYLSVGFSKQVNRCTMGQHRIESDNGLCIIVTQ